MADLRWAIRWQTVFMITAAVAGLGGVLVVAEVLTDDEMDDTAISEVLATCAVAAGPMVISVAVALLGYFLAAAAERVLVRIDDRPPPWERDDQ